MAVFSIDLPGRVKNFELPRTKPLMPLFETIVNSIYAIEERQQIENDVDGYINIQIVREAQMRVQTEGIDLSLIHIWRCSAAIISICLGKRNFKNIRRIFQ